MNRIRVGLGCAVALVLGVSSASAQGTVKIGLINVLSGQFADAGIQLDNGVKTYMKQHGDTVAGKKIEIIRRDVGGPAPDVAKRFAQELVVRDGVDILAGFLLTPNALAAADVSADDLDLLAGDGVAVLLHVGLDAVVELDAGVGELAGQHVDQPDLDGALRARG